MSSIKNTIMILILQASSVSPALAAADTADTTFTPSGTLLLPLAPKLDEKKAKSKTAVVPTSTNNKSNNISTNEQSATAVTTVAAEKATISEDQDDAEVIDESKTLKGTIQIVADDTEFDQNKNTFLGTGNAIAIIGGQNSKLQADSILYDQANQTIDARGNVSILRNGQLTTGSSFKFNVTSDEYLITQPETRIDSTQIVARKSIGNKTGIAYKNGTMEIPTPFFFAKNYFYGPLSYRDDVMEQKAHPEAYLPDKPSFKFKANKMVYERYKDQGNLTIFGGRMEMGNFSIPVGKLVTTVGQTDTKTVFPITPYLGNNLYAGGINIGPQFNTGIGKSSTVSWSPMVQFGGRDLSSNTTTKGIGLAGRVAFYNPNFQTHLAYGSVNHLLVADIKARLYRSTRLQAGINRFLNDGMLGMVRPRLMLEAVDTQRAGNIPYLSMLTFRTSAGWAQDDPQLVNISSTYAKLHGNPTSTVMTAACRVQEQIMFSTHPIFNIGDEKYGASSYLYGGAALRGYSTGDGNLITQLGPILDVHLDRLRLKTGYTSSTVNGKSPFVFDEYIQGQNSVYLQGDVKVNKYLTLGGMVGYNMTQKLSYSRQLIAAIGPPDFKLIVGRDFIFNNYRVGFNVLYGQPVQFNRLVFKGNPDQGQLGTGGI